MHVRSPFPRPQATRCVTMAVARLLLLCRKARALPTEALLLVHNYLVVHVGASCLVWLKQVLEAKLLAFPRGVYRKAKVSFLVSHTIDYEVYRVDDYKYGRTTRARMVAMHGQPVQVEAHLFYYPDQLSLVAVVPAGRRHAAGW